MCLGRYHGRPHYNALMLEDFGSAGEKSKGLTISYSFDRWKQPDRSLFVKYDRGKDTQDEFGAALDDQEEFDFTSYYKHQADRLKDLWVRARYAETKPCGTITWSSTIQSHYFE